MEHNMADKIVVTVDIDLEELIPGFLENRRKDIGSLKESLADEDLEKLRSIGHSLKGVGGGYGFNGLSEIGANIETIAKSGESAGIEVLINDMDDYLNRVEIVYE
jgi:HPt (histidine-containing phosphotransfer) domain-containing protein